MQELRYQSSPRFHLCVLCSCAQEAIVQELRYQSSLDLDQATYQSIRHLPIAQALVQHARQQLVSRLDNAAEKHPILFQKVRQ